MKDGFDKLNLRDTINEFQEFTEYVYQFDPTNEKLNLFDKVYEYLIELELYYEGEK
jgi:hypothetical protein